MVCEMGNIIVLDSFGGPDARFEEEEKCEDTSRSGKGQSPLHPHL